MTKLDIANAALVRTGQRLLQSLDDVTADATLVNILLDDSVREVLREAKPSAAKKRALLVQKAETPLFGYSYAYQLPSDYIGGLECYDRYGNKNDEVFWQIEGDAVLSNETVLYATYVYDIEDLDLLDVSTARAISLKLAIQMAYSKTENKNLVEGLINEYEGLILKKSKSLDAIESRRDTRNIGELDWIDSRNMNFNI